MKFERTFAETAQLKIRRISTENKREMGEEEVGMGVVVAENLDKPPLSV